jgi:hypothetical protein
MFSVTRWWGIVLKEFLQLKRDRITFGMVVGIPIIQIVLFGYAINTDPKQLPTAVVMADRSEFTRSYLAAMKNSGYFLLVDELPTRPQHAPRWRAATSSSSSASGRLQPPPPARRTPGDPDRGRCHRPGGHRRRARLGARAGGGGRQARTHRRAGAAGGCAGAVRGPGAQALQPRRHRPAQHRAGADGRHPDMTMVMMTGWR